MYTVCGTLNYSLGVSHGLNYDLTKSGRGSNLKVVVYFDNRLKILEAGGKCNGKRSCEIIKRAD